MQGDSITLARFSSKNTVKLASEDAKIGVVQMVYLPLHLPDEEPPPYMSRGPKLLQGAETDWYKKTVEGYQKV